ncbi:MAG: class I SAM-dependent methyltransferase [Coxiellaceae bacterium]|nr:class I SAM-dependent methyltransferase [Coxiellaceae bacterium]
MTFRDFFSGHADDYKNFRPTYPDALFNYLAGLVASTKAAWDCGTGNGQGAKGLAHYFDEVMATDASAQQIEQAEAVDNITYRVATAESSSLGDESVSLVTVFQALHWFDLDGFFAEVRRVLQPGGVIAIVGYNTAITDIKAVDTVYNDFCFDYLWQKECWAMERKSLNDGYQSIGFPFDEILPQRFTMEVQWNYHDYLSYLNTWSAVKIHMKKYNENPIETFMMPKIENLWPDKQAPRTVRFPLILRLGKMLK